MLPVYVEATNYKFHKRKELKQKTPFCIVTKFSIEGAGRRFFFTHSTVIQLSMFRF